MEKWEYMPTFIQAEARSKEIKEFLQAKMPDQKRFPRYMAEAMIPELNRLGADGWEMVHMEPVAAVGSKGDVYVSGDGEWSHVYFCVFKRRVQERVQVVMPVDAAGHPAFPAQQPQYAQYPQQPPTQSK